jgi:hypothetical protein
VADCHPKKTKDSKEDIHIKNNSKPQKDKITQSYAISLGSHPFPKSGVGALISLKFCILHGGIGLSLKSK